MGFRSKFGRLGVGAIFGLGGPAAFIGSGFGSEPGGRRDRFKDTLKSKRAIGGFLAGGALGALAGAISKDRSNKKRAAEAAHLQGIRDTPLESAGERKSPTRFLSPFFGDRLNNDKRRNRTSGTQLITPDLFSDSPLGTISRGRRTILGS